VGEWKRNWTDRYLNAMLEAVELPARVSDLDTGLADVDRDALPHGAVGMVEQRREMGGGVKALGRRERRVRRRLSLRCSARVPAPPTRLAL